MRSMNEEEKEGAATEELSALLKCFDALPFYVLLVDEDHHIHLANKAVGHALGKDPKEILGGYCPKVVHGLDDPFPGCPLEEAVEKGHAIEKELFDSTYTRWVKSMCYPTNYRTKEGKAIYLHMVSDITDQKQAEEKLEESGRKYRTLFEDSRDAVYISSKEGEIITFNQAGIELFGYTREEIADINVKFTYQNPEDREKFQKEIEKKGSIKDFEAKLRKKDGTIMDCLLTSTARLAHDGTVLGYQGIIRNITELKNHERQLLNVVINTSHLINTPLTVVFGYLDLIKLGLKKMTPELIDVFHEKLSEIRSLLIEELGMKVQELTLRTSDGWTPVKKEKEEQIHEANYDR